MLDLGPDLDLPSSRLAICVCDMINDKKPHARVALFNVRAFSCPEQTIYLKIINSSLSLSILLSLILPISSYFGRPALILLIAILSDRRLVRVKIGMCPSRAISFVRRARGPVAAHPRHYRCMQ